MPPAETLLAGRRLLIFDLDGTLADTSPVHAAAFAAALEMAVDYSAIAGLSTQASVRLLLAGAGRPADEDTVARLVAAKRAAARAGLAAVREVAGAGAFVARAGTRHRLALCTSAIRASAEATLAAIGLSGRFEPLVTADDVARAKPAPDAFLAVLDRARVPAAQALVFEDSDAGLAAAAAAGLDAIRVGERGAAWADLSRALAGVAA